MPEGRFWCGICVGGRGVNCSYFGSVDQWIWGILQGVALGGR
jgi:hypothetical protein